MNISPADLSPERLYKVLSNTVTPRPIALVSTLDAQGRRNAAPFSFFNVFSNVPPLVIIGIEGDTREAGHPLKDTARNIHDTGEFVVNLVSHQIAQQMVVCSLDFDKDVCEFSEAGFTPRPSRRVAAPGIAESPASLECRVANIQYLPYNRCIVTGEILHMHFAEGMIDEDLHVDGDKMDLVGRLHGPWYATTRDRFQIPRVSVADWQAANTG